MARSYSAIDITKYIAALCVVSIHTFTTSPIHNIGVFLFVQGIARLAVPFFLCCTGYFLGKKGIEDSKVVLPYIIKIFRLYFIWSLVYIPLQIIKMAGTHTLNTKNILAYLHFVLVQASFVHLWYFPAIIVAVFVLHKLFRYKVRTKTIISFVALLYFIGMLGDGYNGLLQALPQGISSAMNLYTSIFQTTRNGIFLGIPFVFIGIMIAKYEQPFLRLKHQKWLIVSLVCLLVEVYLLRRYSIPQDYNMVVFIVPTTIFLFGTLLKAPDTPRWNTNILRKYSTLIYVSHLLFYGILLAILSITPVAILEYGITQFLLVAVMSQCFAYCVVKLSHKSSFQWLNAIY